MWKKLDPYLTPFSKFNWKYIVQPNVRAQNYEALEESTERKFHDIAFTVFS